MGSGLTLVRHGAQDTLVRLYCVPLPSTCLLATPVTTHASILSCGKLLSPPLFSVGRHKVALMLKALRSSQGWGWHFLITRPCVPVVAGRGPLSRWTALDARVAPGSSSSTRDHSVNYSRFTCQTSSRLVRDASVRDRLSPQGPHGQLLRHHFVS